MAESNTEPMTDEPSTTASRRAVLAAGVCSLAPGTGCIGLGSDPPMLDIIVYNQTDSQYTVTMKLYRVGNDQTRSEALAFQSEFEIEPQGVAKREQVAENDRHLLRYDVDRIVENDPLETDHDHAHLYPTSDSETNSVAFDIVGSGELKKRIQ